MKSRILTSALDLAEGRSTVKSVIEKTIAHAKELSTSLGQVNLAINDEASIQAADEIDTRLSKKLSINMLSGLPIALKDNFAMKNTITTAGSKYLQTFSSPYNATIVDIFEKSNAIVCMKSNLDEFGMGSSMLNSAYGPCINPWSSSTQLCAGGSSGASAVSVASGLVPVAIGSDTGGSVRLPASYCGIVGLKPTYGVLSRYGLISYASSLDTPGIMSTSVLDAAIVFDYLAQYDRKDSTNTYSIRNKLPQTKITTKLYGGPAWDGDILPVVTPEIIHHMLATAATPTSLAGITVGFPIEYNIEELDDQSRNALQSSINQLRAAGAIIKEISIPSLKDALPCYYLIACAEASSNLARYDGVRYGQRVDIIDGAMPSTSSKASVSDLHKMISSTRGTFFGSEVIKRILTGTFVLSKDAYDEYYGQAVAVRQHIRREVDNMFNSGIDVIIGPTSPLLPYDIRYPPNHAEMMLNDYFTVIANLIGAPAMSVPVDVVQRSAYNHHNHHVDEDMVPVGIQLISRAHHEEVMIRVGHALEQSAGFSAKIPSHVRRFH